MTTEDELIELKRVISTLKWDIPFIKNNELKAFKEQQLMECTMRLKKLQENQAEVA